MSCAIKGRKTAHLTKKVFHTQRYKKCQKFVPIIRFLLNVKIQLEDKKDALRSGQIW